MARKEPQIKKSVEGKKNPKFDLCLVKYVILFLLDQRRVFLSRKKEKRERKGEKEKG